MERGKNDPSRRHRVPEAALPATVSTEQLDATYKTIVLASSISAR